MLIRPAALEDAPAISAMLQELVAAGKRTARADADFVRTHYITGGLLCSVAVEGDEILGLQSLKRAEAGNPYDTPEGWGIIGTHVSPRAARKGVGRGLFAASLAAAEQAGLPAIEAYIQRSNTEGHGYYGAMSFRPWREDDKAIARRYDLT
ncbi:GNAT family N-acetyltransferase [Oceanicola sp. S124]|uniref:GNAT family N-acetyltransferase n=1 Tax=Oceanicola sp. S124 TaxID=1042378 RepID=UPI0002558586|nr:GNAT family N-acetyltransferase [Oceanicola sp. S124]